MDDVINQSCFIYEVGGDGALSLYRMGLWVIFSTDRSSIVCKHPEENEEHTVRRDSCTMLISSKTPERVKLKPSDTWTDETRWKQEEADSLLHRT